jgi:hypothetical protein
MTDTAVIDTPTAEHAARVVYAYDIRGHITDHFIVLGADSQGEAMDQVIACHPEIKRRPDFRKWGVCNADVFHPDGNITPALPEEPRMDLL